MHHTEAKRQNFLRFHQMAEIGAAVFAADRAAALRIDRALVARVLLIFDVDDAFPGIEMPMPAVAGRHHAVEEIHAAVHRLDDVPRRSDAHEIARLILRHIFLNRRNGIVHFRGGLPYRESADFLHIKAGGSVCAPSYYTLDNRMHYIYQEGRTVFKYAVANMADACEAVMERNHLTKEDIDWVIPHQANMRIITAVSQRLGVSPEKVMVNIERYGNTSAGTLPLCVWDFEDKLKKGDKLIFTAFGAGFAWGAIYVKWGYDGKG